MAEVVSDPACPAPRKTEKARDPFRINGLLRAAMNSLFCRGPLRGASVAKFRRSCAFAQQLSEPSLTVGLLPPSALVMKPIAQLDVDLSRLVKVRAAERVGAVQQESIVS